MRCAYHILLLTLGVLGIFAQDDDLPTLYDYYTSGNITSGLSVDQSYFTLNGKNITIFSGAMHYFRIPSQYWQDRLRKLRAAGLNTVETYIPWNLHEPKSGSYDFGSGGSDMERFLYLEGFLDLAKREDLFVIIRPGPYICAEWEWGGFPSWLLRENDIKVRTSDPVYMNYVTRYFNQLLPIIARYQFTKGGPVIAVQVENEYGSATDIDKQHLQELVQLMKNNGIIELLVTSDGPHNGVDGTLPGTLFHTINFGSDPEASFETLEELQPGKPLMAMEFYPGWFDHWSEDHHTVSDDTFSSLYQRIISYPASVNIYMFHGGTNWGFMNGANLDNSSYQPTTTSYDYDAPLTEAGDYTSKYTIIRDLMEEFNPIKTKTPDPPELKQRQIYPTLVIEGQLNFNDIVKKAPGLNIGSTLSMEKLSANEDNGQSYGYIIYHKTNLEIPADSILTITGYIHDTVMVLINGQLVSNPLSSSDDFNKFGYWNLENSSLTLTSTNLTEASLDLVVENWGRANFGNIYNQMKGLTNNNRVYINDQEISSWFMYPIEFKKSWTTRLSGWKSTNGNDLEKGPGLYKTSLTIDTYPTDYYNDTFIDMREWNKGIVIVNGFVLGRYASIGPQHTLYLPGPFLQHGENEIIIFEQFEPVLELKFSKNANYGQEVNDGTTTASPSNDNNAGYRIFPSVLFLVVVTLLLCT